MRGFKLADVSRALLAAATAAALAPTLAVAAPPVPAGYPEFQKVWARADYPVQQGVVGRSWLWGPQPNATVSEPLAESPGGMRQVQYYDKARMEINNPRMDPASPWYVTNGLLVVEMISGRMQVGANAFEQRSPAQLPVAGDTTEANPAAVAPTYAALAGVASLVNGEHRATPAIGAPVTATLASNGTVGTLPPGSTALQRLVHYEQTTGHNIPDVFWTFMNQQGLVYENGGYHQGQVFDWLYAMGYPVTEPYWINIRINNRPVQVMIQAFQRRILTYNPTNQEAWQVEMGNVGMQYYQWRYSSAGAPTPVPIPATSPTPVLGGHSLTTRRLDLPQPLNTREYSGITNPLYTAVIGEKDWQDLWARHTSMLDPKVPAPTIDWNREFVVAAFWGDKPNSCYHLDIDSVSLAGTTITAQVTTGVKQGTCLQVITQPNDILAVSRQGLGAPAYKVVFKDASGNTLNEVNMTLP